MLGDCCDQFLRTRYEELFRKVWGEDPPAVKTVGFTDRIRPRADGTLGSSTTYLQIEHEGDTHPRHCVRDEKPSASGDAYFRDSNSRACAQLKSAQQPIMEEDYPFYTARTRSFGTAAFLLGWVLLAVMFFFPAPWRALIGKSSTAIDVVVVLIVFGSLVACLIFLFRSISSKADEWEDHFFCASLSAAAFVVLLVMIAAPLVDMMADSVGIRDRRGLQGWRRGVSDASIALSLGLTLIVPLQFLWRRSGVLKRFGVLILYVAVPSSLSLTMGIGRASESWSLFFLSLPLTLVVSVLTEACRRLAENNLGLKSPLVSAESPKPTHVYIRTDDTPQIGIAVSGGGYRASLFGLGALMYIHEACTTQTTNWRKVVGLTSVSGGSLTNALVAHGARIGKDAVDAFDRLSRLLIRHTVSTGSMFSGIEAKLYYRFLLPVSAAIFLYFGWMALRNITWPIFWRAVSIPAGIVLLVWGWSTLMAKLPTLKIDWLDTCKDLGLLFGGPALMGWFLIFILSDSLWRLSLGWLAAALLLMLAVVLVYWLRGLLIQRNFDKLLHEITDSPRLAEVYPDTHHVFCATEV